MALAGINGTRAVRCFAERSHEWLFNTLDATGEITTVPGRVLADQVQLDCAARLQLLRFSDQLRDWRRPVFAAHQRYRTEGARVIAAFTHLQKGCVRCARAETAQWSLHVRCGGGQQALRTQLRNQLLDLGESYEEIDFRYLALELRLVALHHAAHC